MFPNPETIATVKIVAPTDEVPAGFVIINEADFNPKTMKKFVEPATADTK